MRCGVMDMGIENVQLRPDGGAKTDYRRPEREEILSEFALAL
jgi:hypothetical protein